MRMLRERARGVPVPAEQGGDDGPGAAGGEWAHLRAGGAGQALRGAGKARVREQRLWVKRLIGSSHTLMADRTSLLRAGSCEASTTGTEPSSGAAADQGADLAAFGHRPGAPPGHQGLLHALRGTPSRWEPFICA
jgi:hypothetical protein